MASPNLVISLLESEIPRVIKQGDCPKLDREILHIGNTTLPLQVTKFKSTFLLIALDYLVELQP
jgi:hypothetical protein